jgi:hypothetical protein
MRWYRTLLFVLAASSPFIIAAAIGQQPAPPPAAATAPAPPPPRVVKPNAEGAKVLADAIRQLDSKNLTWVQTNFWEQADLQGLTFQAEGTYLSAPGHRLHMDLQVHMADTGGKLEVVSDGERLWEAVQFGQQPRVVTKKVELSKVLDSLKGQTSADQVREEFFQAESFAGVGPLLQNVQKRMIVTNRENVQREGRNFIKLTADWGPEIAKAISAPDKPWPAYLARQCVIYFESLGTENTLWPRRLEWWGPAPPRPGEVLLLQIEFRDPKLNQPLSPERSAKEFKFDPGPSEVPDRTDQVVGIVKARAEQLAGKQK